MLSTQEQEQITALVKRLGLSDIQIGWVKELSEENAMRLVDTLRARHRNINLGLRANGLQPDMNLAYATAQAVMVLWREYPLLKWRE